MIGLPAHALQRDCYSWGVGLHEGIGNIKARREWVVVGVGGQLLKTSFAYFVIHLSQTLKSHEWEDVRLRERKIINQTQTPNPQKPNFQYRDQSLPAEGCLGFLPRALTPPHQPPDLRPKAGGV